MSDPIPPLGESRRAWFAEGTVEYFASGAGPAVLLLPALARSAVEFNPLVMRLNEAGFRTLAVHFPGIGRSRRRFRPRATLWDYADDLVRVLDDAGVPERERVHVVGRGLGNRVARAFATRHGERTAGLVLLAAGGKHRTRPPLSAMLRTLVLQAPGLPLTVRRSLLEPMLCARRGVLPESFCRRQPLRALLQQSGAARRTDAREWWSAGHAPMLVVQGEDDRIAPPAFAMELAREFPDRVQLKLLPDAGHALLYDRPDEVIAEVLRFLRR
jgi:pimeloyl-ACP methyl ester carboxylesterase